MCAVRGLLPLAVEGWFERQHPLMTAPKEKSGSRESTLSPRTDAIPAAISTASKTTIIMDLSIRARVIGRDRLYVNVR